MAKRKKPPLSTVVAFMSDEGQARAEAQSSGLTMLPLDSILPDPAQPRRLLPDDLAQVVGAGSLPPVEAIREWMRRAEESTADTTLRHNTDELKRLADSIAQHGLISPISVRQPRPGESLPARIEYLIVTGERRYWAHVYLLSQGREIHEGETITDPAQIKVTLTAPGVTVRAHQLIENLLREDINAVERARGLWALRYELSGLAEQPIAPESQGEPDEVNHGSPEAGPEQQLVPWARVEEALGISKRYRIFMTSVLNLSPEAAQMVARHNLTERTIRPIVQKLKDRPDLQVKALQQLIAWQAEAESDDNPGRSIVASVKELVDKLLAGQAQTEPAQTRVRRSVSSAPVIRFQARVRQTLDFLNRLKSTDRAGLTEALSRDEFADVRIDLRNLRQQIDEILENTSNPRPEQAEKRPAPPQRSPNQESEPE